MLKQIPVEINVHVLTSADEENSGSNIDIVEAILISNMKIIF